MLGLGIIGWIIIGGLAGWIGSKIMKTDAQMGIILNIVVGIVGAVAVTRFLSSLLFAVTPTDPVTFAAVALLLLVVSLAALYRPTRRALRVDPMVALRRD